jgi:hypothetical protein
MGGGRMNGIVGFGLCTLSDKELLQKVDKMTDAMYKTGKIPTRNIPALPNDDYDLLVGELIVRFNKLISHDTSFLTNEEVIDLEDGN